jgi:hypothetical protein
MMNTIIPAGQLDLSDGPDQLVPDHFKSYRELFFSDDAQSLNAAGQVIDQVPATDGAGNPLFQQAVDGGGNPLFKQLTDMGGNPLFIQATDNDIPVLDGAGNPVLVPLHEPATDGAGNPILVQDTDTSNNPLFDAMGNPILIQAFREATDTNGNPILIRDFTPAGNPLVDGMGNPIPRQAVDAAGALMVDGVGNPVFIPDVIPYMEAVLITVTIPQVMSVNGALASNNFFSKFEDPGDTTHFGTLLPSELKMIAEWLDIGAQYYNNPFDVPP